MGSAWEDRVKSKRVQENESLADVLEAPLALCPEKAAIVYEDQPISYRELDEAANRVANGLIAAGIRPGDRVAMHVDNRPDFIYGFLGAMRAGAVLVPTNVMYTKDEMTHILGDSGAKAVFALAPFVGKILSIEGSDQRTVISVGGEAEGATTLEAFMSAAEATRPAVKRNPKEVALIQYTSGTTGTPKGAMVSDYNVLMVLENTTGLPGSFEPTEDDVTLLTLPLFHSYALNLAINRAFTSAQTMILHNRFHPVKAFEDIEKYKVTIFYGAPPMYHAFVNTPGLEKYDATSLKGSFSGAAPLPVVIMEKFKAMTGVQISEGYGLSETAPTLSSNMAGPSPKPGTVGPPIRDVKIRIVDADDNEVPQGEVGEICAQGPNIFLGYWNRPEATAEAMRNGWFHTGDMGKFDEDGYLTIVDRMKDMIVVSGFNVYPIEIENVILRHPKVQDCAVIGIADGYQGESVKACVVLHEGQAMDHAELEAYCREHLAAFKVPKHMSIRSELPKNATGKLLKRVLREEEGGVTKAAT